MNPAKTSRWRSPLPPLAGWARFVWPVCVLLTVLACRRGEQAGKPTNKSTAKYQLPTTEPGKFNVAFVYVGPIGDGGWTYAHDLGRRELIAKIPDVHTAYVESVSEGSDAEQVLRALARKGFDLLITTSFGYMDATEAVASEFPQQKFLHISGYKKNDSNFGNAFGAMEDMKYLSGMVAGGRAKADNNPRLGYLAPFAIPEVVRLANAVMRGAKVTCPECTMQVRWIDSWFDPGKEQEAAESLFAAGVDVIISGADTTGAIVVAGQKDRWAIGYDSKNACDVNKKRCLTVSYWSWGVLYVDVVQQIRAGTWKPSSYYGEANSGLVGLAGFEPGATPSDGIPVETVQKVQARLSEMRAGRFTRFDVFGGPILDNSGKTVLPAGQKLSQLDLEGLPGCTVCMSWLAEGIVGQLPHK